MNERERKQAQKTEHFMSQLFCISSTQELFLQACQKLGVKPVTTLMVGDSPTDIEMGRKAGAAGCIGICWGKAGVQHLQAADIAIAHLEEIQVL